jgi:hypothetical protein
MSGVEKGLPLSLVNKPRRSILRKAIVFYKVERARLLSVS